MNTAKTFMDIKPPMPPELAVFSGICAGFARQAHQWVTDRKEVKLPAVLARGFVSGFSAYVFYLVASRVSPDHIPLACSLGGWLGVEGITVILTRFSPDGRAVVAPAVEPDKKKP